MNMIHSMRGKGKALSLPSSPCRVPVASAIANASGFEFLTTCQCGARVLVVLLLMSSALICPSPASAAEGWSADADSVAYAVSTNADASLVVAGQRNNAVVAYDATGAKLWQFATEGTVYDVAVSANGERIAVASEDRNVYVLDGTGVEVWRHRGLQTVLSVSISGDGRIIAAGSQDRSVTLFDANGSVSWQYTASDQVTQVAVYGGASAFRLVAGTRDSRVTLLDGNGQAVWESRLGYGVRGLAVVANDAYIAAGDDRETLYLLDGAGGSISWQVTMGSPVPAVAISADGSVFLAGTEAGVFVALDAKGNQTQRIDTGRVFTDMASTSDASVVAVATESGVATYPRNNDGAFQAPKDDSSSLTRFLVPVLAGIALVLAIAIGLGSRRNSSGERAWRDVARSRRSSAAEIWKARTSYLFLLPTLSLLLIFNYYPAFSGMYHAFTEWTPGIETRWVGLGQFRDLGNNRYFWTGIGNLLLLIVTGFVKLLVPLAVAEMIFHVRSPRAGYAFRTLLVLQVIVPGVVGVLLWVNIYDPNIGLANQLLESVGLGGLTRSWLGDADTAMWAIVFMGFPWVRAFALLIFYGGLISIPGELFDSAALDGASTLRRIFNIDLPLLLGQVRLLLILTFIATVQEFAAIFLTTGGGPGSSTYVPSLELYYQAVRFNNFGAASAIGAVLFLVILGGTILNLKYVKSSVEYGT